MRLVKRSDASMPVSHMAPFSEADWQQSHSTIAGHNQSNAAKWLLPLLAGGGAMGVAGGLYENRKKQQQAEGLAGALRPEPSPVPMGLLGKSASLEDAWKFMSGGNAHGSTGLAGMASVPWFLPAAAASLYGGHQIGKSIATGVGNRNLAADSEESLRKEKENYINAVRQNDTNTVPMLKAAMDKSATDWSPSTFSMDNLGPALGLGAGVVGGLGAVNFIGNYDKEKRTAQQLAEQVRQKKLDAATAHFSPEEPSALKRPVVFNA